eukprot:5158302-Alexandrium_andersonii.AAC.1
MPSRRTSRARGPSSKRPARGRTRTRRPQRSWPTSSWRSTRGPTCGKSCAVAAKGSWVVASGRWGARR